MNYVKENLKFYIPALTEFIGDVDFSWEIIDRKFSEKIRKRIHEANGSTILVEASIYDLIVSAKKGDSTTIGLLHFLNCLFEDLTDTLDSNEKLCIKGNLRQMLLSFDHKYLNFLGELATLNNILKSGNYKLLSSEVKMSNGKTADFKFKKLLDNTSNLVEIDNIHLDSDRVESNPELIKKFLNNRLQQKILDKTKGLDMDIPFYLIPVIWGGWKDIKIYSEFFKMHKLELKNVIEPVAYLTYTNHQGYYEHHFKTISHLFQ